jgi:hypothetical protein
LNFLQCCDAFFYLFVLAAANDVIFVSVLVVPASEGPTAFFVLLTSSTS